MTERCDCGYPGTTGRCDCGRHLEWSRCKTCNRPQHSEVFGEVDYLCGQIFHRRSNTWSDTQTCQLAHTPYVDVGDPPRSDTYYMRCTTCRIVYPFKMGLPPRRSLPHGPELACEGQDWEPATEADRKQTLPTERHSKG